MSNSVNFVQSPADRDARHPAAYSCNALTETLLDMAAVMNRASENVADAQGHLNNFRVTGNREEFGAFIGDWGRLDFDVFVDLMAGVRAIYRALGAHTLDDRRQTLVAILGQVRAADDTRRTIARERVRDIRELVVEVADGARDAQVRGLVQEIDNHLVRLEGGNLDRERGSSPLTQFQGFRPIPGGDDPYANANLARSLLNDARMLDAARKAELEKRNMEDRRESDYQYGRTRNVQRKWDKDAIEARRIYGEASL
ncbi:MAG: hypothetical protein LBF26_01090 [Puniceicoccales bacterium]|jgi:hypothetical protein|nr:hypothetical protein [Puniceicoccales bacterium]